MIRKLINKCLRTELAAATALIMSAMLLTACSSGADKYALRDEGIALYQSGDYAAAEAKFDEALDASDGQVSELQYDILKYKAECRLRQGDALGAKENYEALLELEKDTENAAEYESVLAELDNLDRIEEGLGLMDSGSYKDAAGLFEEMASLDKGLAGSSAWFNLAVCREYMGDFEEARRLWQQYVEVYPDDEAALKELRFCESRV